MPRNRLLFVPFVQFVLHLELLPEPGDGLPERLQLAGRAQRLQPRLRQQVVLGQQLALQLADRRVVKPRERERGEREGRAEDAC